MSTISKKEIVKTVSERHGLTTTQTGQIVQVFMDQIIEELSRGNRIEFREFGIFELKRRKPRTARNPKTGDSVQVPEKTVVSFKPGKVMKAKVVDTVPVGGESAGGGDDDEDEDDDDDASGETPAAGGAPSAAASPFPSP